jgi:type VI secretion system protein ImpM
VSAKGDRTMGLADDDTVPSGRHAEPPPGWYGKLSTLGDFAQRRLPAHWVQRCDSWLSGLMHDLPTVLGPRWLEAYLTAPVQRFAWAPGVIDMRWWFGVLMPSCDNVGRYFPLLIAQARAQPPLDRAGLDHLERWYAALAQAAMDTLEDGASMDTLERALASAPAWPVAPSAAPPPAEAAEGPWHRFAVPMDLPLAAWVGMLAMGELMERLAGCTLWWPRAPQPHHGTLRWGPGLPSSAEFASLLRAG